MRCRALLLVLALVATGCSGGDDAEVTDGDAPETSTTTAAPTTAAPSTTTTAAPTTTVGPPPDHRIQIRQTESGPQFVDTATGERFIGRGFNHWQWQLIGGFLMDRTFNAGENQLDQAIADLEEMASYGYNAVRIWVNACFNGARGCLSDDEGGLREEYLDNLATYLDAARDNGIFVIFTVDDPNGLRYEQSRNDAQIEDFFGFNQLDLTTAGIEDQVRFWEDVVGGLVERGAALDAIWAYELRNEQFFESDLFPFGIGRPVTTANGETYDMTDPDEVKRMRDEGVAHWARTLATAIKALDPTALVTVGYFMSGEGPVDLRTFDRRLVDPRPLLEVDEIDFLDFREYPGFAPGGWDSVWTNSLLSEQNTKPIILGEFGAFYIGFDTVPEAVTAHTEWMADACQAGLQGFLGWVWDNQGLYTETWPAVAEGGALAEALSPSSLPDPCDRPPPATGNLAYNRPVTASSFEDTEEFLAPATNAVDGSMGSWWTAPGEGPQWIEIDLEADSTVTGLRLTTELAFDTPVVVTVDLRSADGTTSATHRFETEGVGSTLVFEHTFAEPVDDVRFALVTTVRDGWTIWNEIEILGER